MLRKTAEKLFILLKSDMYVSQAGTYKAVVSLTNNGRWLPTLGNLVAQINETFSRNFQEMAIDGEVLFDELGNEFDGVLIITPGKFRQTGQLQVLSGHHQSGVKVNR